MSAPTPRDALLAAVERSPEAVAAHDRAAWVSVFSAEGQVEDPVGSRPHVGHAAIERFYDTFIAPRTIEFRRDVDIVVGTTVVRDLQLGVDMGHGVQMSIPAYLRYDLAETGGDFKVIRLQAFWELPAMIATFARAGRGAAPAGLGMAGALLRNQGLGGAVGFASGMRTGGARAKRRVAAVLSDAAAGDELAIKRRLVDRVQVTRGDQARIALSDFVGELAGAEVHKVIAAGHCVVAGISRGSHRAVVIAESARDRPGITALRLFAE